MMGTVPPQRRGIAAGARTLLQNTGAVLSIAFVMAVVTSSIPKATLFAIFSGLATGLSAAKLDPFIANMHVALWALAGVSLLGTVVCLLRPSHSSDVDDGEPIGASTGEGSADGTGAHHAEPRAPVAVGAG